MATNFFGPVDGALVRIGITSALIGLLLLALHFILPWSNVEMTVILCLTGFVLATLGAYLHHANKKEREKATSAPLVHKNKAS